MISVSDIGMHYGRKTLFEKVSFQLTPGKRYGLVGANGSGKSTLLNILEGTIEPETGTLSIPSGFRLGTLGQDHFKYENERIIDTVIMGKATLWKALQEKERLAEEPEITEEIGHRIAHLEMIVADQNGYNAEATAGEILSGLGIPAKQHHLPLSTLSGGFKLRVLLAQCLFNEPDALLLDEPTNHLDIIAIAWLESFLQEYAGILLVVSHDQTFLNSVATHIMDVDYEAVKIYPGNYDQFLQAKALEREQKETAIARQEKKREDMQAFVDRFKAKATKARQAASRVKQIDRMETIEIKRSSRVAPSFSFPIKRPSGKSVLRFNNISKSFGDKEVLRNISFTLERGEKIAVIGPNGIGKSTLLKIAVEALPPSAGTVEHGHEVHNGYFAQDHHEILAGDSTPYEWLYSYAPSETIGTIRGMLGRLLFCKEDVHKKNSALSGGEATRLIFARLMIEKPNLLLLDEPTNHMDLETVDALSEALTRYDGSILFVSHYRHFVHKVATGILALTEDGYDYFKGSFQEYLESKGEDYLLRFGGVSRKSLAATETKVKRSSTPAVLNNKKRRHIQKNITRFEGKFTKSEKRIFELEGEIAEIDTLLEDNDIYLPKNGDQLRQKLAAKEERSRELSEEMALWEELHAKLEELKRGIA